MYRVWTFCCFYSDRIAFLKFQLFVVDIGSLRYCGLIIIIIGAAINLKCYWDLIFSGKGTPDPLIPTVMFIEEPGLRRKFGESYEKYFESVPRWIPRLPSYREDNSES
jgi:hypothetical protein